MHGAEQESAAREGCGCWHCLSACCGRSAVRSRQSRRTIPARAARTQYDWDSNEFFLPIGVRVGKVFVTDKGTWNVYGEYQTSLIYDSWPGSAVDTSIRINATFTIPVS